MGYAEIYLKESEKPVFGWMKVWADFKNVKHYFIFTILLFAVGIWIGASSSVLEPFLQQQLEGLEELASAAENADNQALALFGFIFINNAIKAVAIVFIGLISALIPVLFVLINGMVLGYLFASIHASGENILPILIKGILPHGIIELPVILLASAYGIRMGMLLLLWIVSVGEKRMHKKQAFYDLIRLSGFLSIFIVFSLLIAALIEATITPWLLSL